MLPFLRPSRHSLFTLTDCHFAHATQPDVKKPKTFPADGPLNDKFTPYIPKGPVATAPINPAASLFREIPLRQSSASAKAPAHSRTNRCVSPPEKNRMASPPISRKPPFWEKGYGRLSPGINVARWVEGLVRQNGVGRIRQEGGPGVKRAGAGCPANRVAGAEGPRQGSEIQVWIEVERY